MTDIRITISASPAHGISLENEIRLVKPALLYADSVTLYSPVAALLQAVLGVGSSPAATLAVAREIAPMLNPQASAAFVEYERLSALPRPTGRERRRMKEFRKITIEGSRGILEKGEELLAAAGGNELRPALDAGLLSVDPLVRASDGSAEGDQLFIGFMSRLDELLQSENAYPLFDDAVAELVHARLSENLIEIEATPRRRGRQVSMAARFMEGLPAFPLATVAEILDIRDQLQEPLVRFRSAIIEMERLLASASYEPGFAAEVEELYAETVAPALAEIGDMIGADAYLRELLGAAVDHTKAVLTAALTIGVATHLGLQDLVAAATEAALVGSPVVAQGSWQYAESRREAGTNQLFFLYKANTLLR